MTPLDAAAPPPTLQLVPSSGSKSVSLWDVREPEELQQWLDEVRNSPCSSHDSDISSASLKRRSLNAHTPLCYFLVPVLQTINVDVTHEVFEVQVGRGVGGARRPRLTSSYPLASPAPPLPIHWQEEFAIGLGEIARARAAEKVRMPVGCFRCAICKGGAAFSIACAAKCRVQQSNITCSVGSLLCGWCAGAAGTPVDRPAARLPERQQGAERSRSWPSSQLPSQARCAGPATQVVGGTKEVAAQTGRALGVAATSVGAQVGSLPHHAAALRLPWPNCQ